MCIKNDSGMKEGMLGYLFDNYDCIIIEFRSWGYTRQYVIYEEMEKWQEMGKFIVMATQVVNEGSNMEIYQVGQKIKKISVLGI